MQAIVGPFLRYLDDIETNILLVNQLKTLAIATAPPSSARGTLGRAAHGVRDTVRSQRTWEAIALDGSLLFLSAQYEVTVRDLLHEIMMRKCMNATTYADLPETIRTENARLIGDLLRSGSRDPTVDGVKVVEDFVQCSRVGRPVVLYFEGFANHDRNLSPDELKRVMNRAGVSDFWPRIGRDHDVQSHLSCSNESAAITGTHGVLKQFIADRNAISHRGPGYQTIGATVLAEYVSFFRCLMPVLARCLEAHVQEQ